MREKERECGERVRKRQREYESKRDFKKKIYYCMSGSRCEQFGDGETEAKGMG